MSKGSNRRPPAVSREEYEKAWERTFGKPGPTPNTDWLGDWDVVIYDHESAGLTACKLGDALCRLGDKNP